MTENEPTSPSLAAREPFSGTEAGPPEAVSIPRAVLTALLDGLPGATALWTAGRFVAGIGRDGSGPLLAAVRGAVGDPASPALAEFLRGPCSGQITAGGGDRPVVVLTWQGLGRGWWRLTAREATGAASEAAGRRALVAELTHEAKTPLVTLCGYLELLRTRTSLDDRQQRYVSQALDEARHQEALLDAWLQAAASASGHLAVDLAPVDVAEVLEAAASAFHARRPERRLSVCEARPLMARADAARIAEVLANLLDNADRHGGGDQPIRLAAKLAHGEIQVTVNDQGSGIPAEELTRLFEPFYRAPGTEGGGTGLGLAVAEAIVHAHGGHIWAASEPESGTTFAFTLPAERRSA